MQIIIAPIITEKSLAKAQKGDYTFKVANRANKPSIALAIQDLYGVDVISVNIMRIKGEEKMTRNRFISKTKDYKKAIVTLKKGEKITGFGVEEKKSASKAGKIEKKPKKETEHAKG